MTPIGPSSEPTQSQRPTRRARGGRLKARIRVGRRSPTFDGERQPTVDDGDRLWEVVALALGTFVTIAGIMHFVSPGFFDAIVPPWLGPSERFWTYASGVAELVVGPMLLLPRTRVWGARAAIVLFLAVYPANLYMVWDWCDRSIAEQAVSWIRLPFQFVFIWLAWKVASRRTPTCPGPTR